MAIQENIYDDFGKGLNTFTRDTMIKENEAADAYNVWSVGKNSVAKRPGVVKLAEIEGVSKIDGLGTYYNGSTRELLAMAGGKLYKVQTGTPSQIGSTTWTSGLRTDFVQAGGKVFIQNGTDVLRHYDGSSITNQSNGIIGKWLIYYKSCLWTAGNTGAGNATRLYRSGADSFIGDFTNSTANTLATSVYVSKDDGQDLKGFFKHQDYLYAVKERSLWRVSVAADSAGTISLELVDPSRGTDSHFTIDAVENDTFMFNEKGVFATGYEPNLADQIRTNVISLRVDNQLQTIQKSRLDDTCAIFFDNHYYLAYTSGGSSANDRIMVYDRQRLGWWEWSVGANCFAEYKNTDGDTKLYFGSSTDGSIYYFDETAKSDDDMTIVTSWKTPKLSFKNIAQMKFFLTVLLYFGRTAGNVSYSIYVDGELVKTDPEVLIGSSGLAGIGVGAVGTFMVGVEDGSLDVVDSGGGDFVKIPINKLGRDIQIQIEDNNGNKSWELNALIVQYKPLSNQFQPNTRLT